MPAWFTKLFAPRYRPRLDGKGEYLLPRPVWAPFHTEIPGSQTPEGVRLESPGEKLMREAHDVVASQDAERRNRERDKAAEVQETRRLLGE